MSPPTRTVAKPTFQRTSGITRKAWSVGIYGAEGVGKSSLASLCPGIVFADLEHSTRDMNVLRDEVETPGDYAASWANLRKWVQQVGPGVYCIDSVTRAEDWCTAWVIKNKKLDGISASDSIEDWNYGRGHTFVAEEFRRFLGDIDGAILRGASFVLIAHARIAKIKNPDGSDFIRFEPRLIHSDQKSSNMLQFVQFLDHLLFINADVNAAKGKAAGSGTRTIYLDTSPTRMSKTRSLPKDPIPFDEGFTTVWGLLGVKP